MRLCANLNFLFTEHSTYADRYAAAKSHGFQAVEIGFPYNETAESIKQVASLPTVLINTYPGPSGSFGFAAIPGKEEEFKESIAKSLEYADALNVQRLHIMSGIHDPNISRDTCYATLKSNLLSILPELEKRNIVGTIEPINPNTIAGYFLNNYDEALEVVMSINSPNLKLQLDFYHLQHLRGDLSAFFKRAMDHVGHIQIAQVPNRDEPDSDGEIQYGYVFSMIAKSGYGGWIGCEYKPRNGSAQGLGWTKTFGLDL